MQSRIKHLLKHFALVLKAKLNQLKPFVRFVFHPSTLLPSPTYRIIKGLHIQTLFILLYASFSCPYSIYGIFQCRCGKGEFQCFLVIVGVGQQTINHAAYKCISCTHTVYFMDNIVNAGMP